MIKKITFTLVILLLVFSCGKKGDPVYNQENQNSGMTSTRISVFS